MVFSKSLLRQALWLPKSYAIAAYTRLRNLSPFGKFLVFLIISVNALLASIIISMGPERLFQFLYDTSQSLANRPFGWLMLSAFMIVTCFPPLFGYTTAVSVCGFAYGLNGFFVAAPSALFGSAIAFVVLRLVFKRRLAAMREENHSWKALEAVIKAQGLPLIALIRFCPFPPWVYANAMFASIESVSLIQFMIATVGVFPKLLLTVFIGSRVAALSDGETRGQMDTQTKILNIASIVISAVVAFVTGWLVYRLTQGKIRAFEGLPQSVDDEAAAALEHEAGIDSEEASPLLRVISRE